MKKNNTYLADNEIDLGDLIKSLWREKILILSISIIFSLFSYYFLSLKPIKESKTEIILREPPPGLFDVYENILDKNSLYGHFNSELNFLLLSSNNLEEFLLQTSEFDDFKKYLKSNDITSKKYFSNKFKYEKNKYSLSLSFSKELDGVMFIIKYVEFIKKKNINVIKELLIKRVNNKIYSAAQTLETLKLNSKDEIIDYIDRQLLNTNEVTNLIIKSNLEKSNQIIGIKQNIDYLNTVLQKLKEDELNYDIILDRPFIYESQKRLNLNFLPGLILGFFLSLFIIFKKRYNKKKLKI